METLDEDAAVISASKVTGTNVYSTDGDHLGEIYDVMLDKRSGRRSLTPCSRSVAFSASASATMPCPGRHSSTTPGRVAMWWASRSTS